MSPEPVNLHELPPVITTKVYARILGVTPISLTNWWRYGRRHVAQPINPRDYKGYRFRTDDVLRKLRPTPQC